MTYDVEWSQSAVRALRTLNRKDRALAGRVVKAVDQLCDDPRPHGVKALQGRRGVLRIRVGDYRVIYEVQDAHLVVLVLDLGHRSHVYER